MTSTAAPNRRRAAAAAGRQIWQGRPTLDPDTAPYTLADPLPLRNWIDASTNTTEAAAPISPASISTTASAAPGSSTSTSTTEAAAARLRQKYRDLSIALANAPIRPDDRQHQAAAMLAVCFQLARMGYRLNADETDWIPGQQDGSNG